MFCIWGTYVLYISAERAAGSAAVRLNPVGSRTYIQQFHDFLVRDLRKILVKLPHSIERFRDLGTDHFVRFVL